MGYLEQFLPVELVVGKPLVAAQLLGLAHVGDEPDTERGPPSLRQPVAPVGLVVALSHVVAGYADQALAFDGHRFPLPDLGAERVVVVRGQQDRVLLEVRQVPPGYPDDVALAVLALGADHRLDAVAVQRLRLGTGNLVLDGADGPFVWHPASSMNDKKPDSPRSGERGQSGFKEPLGWSAQVRQAPSWLTAYNLCTWQRGMSSATLKI